MIGVVLLGVLFDRPALTMRTLTIAALVVLLFAPESIEPRNRVRHRRSARPDAAATAGFLLIGLLKTPLRWSGGVAAVAATIWAASAPATLGQRRTGARGHRHRTGSQPTSPPHSSIRCPSPFAARIPHQARAAWRECREFPSSLFILLSITVYQTLHFFRHFLQPTFGFITPRCIYFRAVGSKLGPRLRAISGI